jgi:hypothetical protein
MEIHFADPERVPAAFTSLAATLQGSGFDLNTLENSNIPATEIWLICPLNDRNKTLLSCAARVGEQQAATVGVQSGFPCCQTDKSRDSPAGRQELIWEARNSRETRQRLSRAKRHEQKL